MKKIMILLLCMAMITLCTVGCVKPAEPVTTEQTTTDAQSNEQEDDTTVTPEPANVETELNMVISNFTAEPENKVFMNTIIKMFEIQTGCKVNVSYVEQNDTIKKIQTEVESGNVATDVIMVDTAYMKTYLTDNLVADISGVRNGLEVTLTDMFDGNTTVDGKTYFVPISYDIYITVVNREALPYMPETVKVNKDADGNVTEIAAITWEDYYQWALNMAEAGHAKTGFPMSFTSSQLLYAMGGMALANGSTYYPLLNDAGAKAAWDMIADLAKAGAIASSTILSETGSPTSLIANGDVWLSFAHMGQAGTAYSANPDQYVIGPGLSGSTGKAGSTAGAWCYGMVNGAKNTQLSEEWIKFITDPEINYYYCSGVGGAMCPVLEASDFVLGETDTDKIMKVGFSMIENGAITTLLPTADYTSWTAVKELYIELYTELLKGERLTQEQLDAYQQKLEDLLVR